jgi:hypothetical protein
MGEHRLDDRFAAIRGSCRVRADPKTGPPVGETEAEAGLDGATWPTISQSNIIRTAASCCFTSGAEWVA